jgi:cytochrome c551/c552
MRPFVILLFLASHLLVIACQRSDSADSVVAPTTSIDFEDAGRDLPLNGSRGRSIWFKAAAKYSDPSVQPFSSIPGLPQNLSEILTSDARPVRFARWGVINDPDCVGGDKGSFGWDICPGDEGPEGAIAYIGRTGFRDPACELNEVDLSADERKKRGTPCSLEFGTSAGIIGLRKIPNPNYRPAKDPKKPSQDSPYLVGVSCAFCHGGFNPSDQGRVQPIYDHSFINGIVGNQVLEVDDLPPASRIVTPKRWDEAQLTQAYLDFGSCVDCQHTSSISKRISDIQAYIDGESPERLAQAMGVAEMDLVKGPLIGGEPQWRRGQELFRKQCSSCHSPDSKEVIPAKKYPEYCRSKSTHIQNLYAKDGLAPSLKGVWARTPLMGSASIGRPYCHSERYNDCAPLDFDLNVRLKEFELAMNELLNPDQRVWRGPMTLSTQVVQTDLGPLTLPAGLPMALIAKVDLQVLAKNLVKKASSAKTFSDRRIVFEATAKAYSENTESLIKQLEGIAGCKGGRYDAHAYGSDLKDQQKRDLVAFLKTL